MRRRERALEQVRLADRRTEPVLELSAAPGLVGRLPDLGIDDHRGDGLRGELPAELIQLFLAEAAVLAPRAEPVGVRLDGVVAAMLGSGAAEVDAIDRLVMPASQALSDGREG